MFQKNARDQEIYRNLEWCLSLHTVPRMFTRCRLSVSCHGEDLQGFGRFLPNTRAIMTHTQDDPRTTKLQRLHKVVKDEHEERRRKAAGSQSYRQGSYTCPRIALDATNEYLVFMLCSLLLYPCFCFCKLKPDLGRIIERERERELQGFKLTSFLGLHNHDMYILCTFSELCWCLVSAVTVQVRLCAFLSLPSVFNM